MKKTFWSDSLRKPIEKGGLLSIDPDAFDASLNHLTEDALKMFEYFSEHPKALGGIQPEHLSVYQDLFLRMMRYQHEGVFLEGNEAVFAKADMHHMFWTPADFEAVTRHFWTNVFLIQGAFHAFLDMQSRMHDFKDFSEHAFFRVNEISGLIQALEWYDTAFSVHADAGFRLALSALKEKNRWFRLASRLQKGVNKTMTAQAKKENAFVLSQIESLVFHLLHHLFSNKSIVALAKAMDEVACEKAA